MRSGDWKIGLILPVPGEGGRATLFGVESPGLVRFLGDLGVPVDGAPEAGRKYDLVVASLRGSTDSRGAIFGDLEGMLRAGGFAALHVPNRTGYANVLRRIRGAGAPPAGTSTIRGILRSAARRGFEAIDAYGAIPDARNPSVFVPVFDARPLGFLLSHFPDFSTHRPAAVRLLARFLVRCGRPEPLLNDVIVIFRRGSGGVREPGMVTRLEDEALKALGARSVAAALVTRVEIETQAVLLFFFEAGRREPSLVGKVSSAPNRNDELRREWRSLVSVRSSVPASLENSVPAVRGAGEWRGRFYYLQDFSRGGMLPAFVGGGAGGFRRGRPAAGLARAWDWLMGFQAATAGGVRPAADLGIAGLIERCRAAHGAGEKDCLDWIESDLERYAARGVGVSASHGDFFPGNIVLGAERVMVIDWRYFARQRHVCFDVVTLLATLRLSGAGGAEEDDLERILCGGHWTSRFFSERFGTFFAKNGLDRGLFVFLSAAALLEMSIRELEEKGISGDKDASWRRRLVRLHRIRDRITVPPQNAGGEREWRDR